MDIVGLGDRTDHIGCLALFLALHGDSWAKARSYLQRSLRGFSGFSRESSLKISLDRSSAIRGTRIFTSTYWSPRIPGLSSDGAPLPRNRKACPVCVPGGIRRVAGPSIVGTSTFVPNAASLTVSGMLQ